jgi:Iap family predicted aminopeptidase
MAGFLLMNGTSRDTVENSDLDTMRFRDCYGRFGGVPALAMRMIDALDLLHRDPERVHICLQTQSVTVESRNIVVEVPGSDLGGETIAVGAHYDSTPFSCGAWDNGSGVVQVLGLLDFLAKNPPRRTVRAIFFGSEEVGLKGSQAYLAAHPEQEKELLAMVNADVGGSYLGKEMIVVTGTQSAVSYVRGVLYDVGYSARLSDGVMSSDSVVFSDHGVPSISLGQFPPQGGGYMHTRYDNISMISPQVLESEVRFLRSLVDRLANAQVFPIPKVIPKELRQKIMDYFGKGLSHTETVTDFPEEEKPTKPLF